MSAFRHIRRLALACLLAPALLVAEEAAVVLPPIPKDADHPEGVNLKLMSADPEYGYSDKKPIKVGSKDANGGPRSERAFLNLLLDASGKPVTYQRLFSGGNGPDGNVLDCYEVTLAGGKKVRLWIDMYHPKNAPEKQPAPVGFYKKRRG